MARRAAQERTFAARQRLRAAGLRITPVRLRVLETLGACRAPLNAQEVAERLGNRLDRVTLYRTLNTFVERGLAHRVDPGDRIYRFSLTAASAPEGATHSHPHLVCDECGTVECLEDAEVLVRPKRAAGRRSSFRLTQKDAVLHGTCGECAPPPAPARPAHRAGARSRNRG
jgi:Fur family ferric uptake transcriptional regulator